MVTTSQKMTQDQEEHWKKPSNGWLVTDDLPKDFEDKGIIGDEGKVQEKELKEKEYGGYGRVFLR